MDDIDASPPSNDPFSLLDQLSDFPWPAAAFSELRRYVRVVNEFLPHATIQQAVRLKAQIKSEVDPVAIGEFESALENIKVDELTVLPRLVWGGVLVSVYAAFEYGIESIFRHWQISTEYPFQFKKGHKDFLSSAEVYAETQIGIQLFLNHVQRERLLELKDLRNSYVHRGGQVSTLSKRLETGIKNKSHFGLALEIIDGQWVANARSVAFYLLEAERAIRLFSDAAVEKCMLHRST